MKMDFCECKSHVISSDQTLGEDPQSRPAVYAVCASCRRAIEKTAVIADASGYADLGEDDFNFAALPPTFPEPINPWANGHYDPQVEWLLEKRERCLTDIARLASSQDGHPALFDLISRGTIAERRETCATAMLQTSGAYAELRNIERMIGNIRPDFDLDSLPRAPSREVMERRARGALTARRDYYAEEFDSAA